MVIARMSIIHYLFLMIVVFALAWKPLRRRFRGWAVLSAYLLFTVAATVVLVAPDHPRVWLAFSLNVLAAILILLTSRQGIGDRLEERSPTVAWMVVHGLWDQLAKAGVPAGEIERLKRLPAEERANLMARLMASAERARRRVREQVSPKKREYDPDHDWDVGGPDDYYTSFSPYRTRDHWTISGSHHD
jgi:hypothetical protein